MIEFCILGSGMAGSTIANLLSKNLQSKSLIKLEERGADHQTEDLRMARALIMDYSIFIRKISSLKDF